MALTCVKTGRNSLDGLNVTAGKCTAITCVDGEYLSCMYSYLNPARSSDIDALAFAAVSKACTSCAEVFTNALTCTEETALTCSTGYSVTDGKCVATGGSCASTSQFWSSELSLSSGLGTTLTVPSLSCQGKVSVL